ncbi:FAD-dependent oxidoreductase [Paenibacillus sedimenti]|uniref:FAD dependent oxidoreductase n=1 Tax=Paenibacillus sedimenti TaxID=2770274 RepID=A0A926QL08_9BACL|nr:FAD-dependent monooxygenase [Paenibacillus sedimenti]MBD0382077.1 FAD dependent oxidoreductase [Paenibacillus sedimenti]
MNNVQNMGKAIVIGGSIAGLLTARVLSDYYEEVLIVDKDEFPEAPEDRAGTPQAFHPHRFTMRGKLITDRFFSGYEEELVALGAPSSLNKTVHNMNPYGSMIAPYPRNDIKFSRAALEWVLRERVNAIANVRFLLKHDVLRLVTTPDKATVTGVQVRERGTLGQEKILTADLVMDTSGRNSKLASWLEELGYEVPTPDRLKVDLGYSTRRYKVPSHLTALIEQWDVINIMGQPANGTFTGVFSFIENHIAEVVLYRPGGNYPPTNADDYEQAVAQLPSPLITEMLQELEPITAPRGYRVPELYRHHFEQMKRWPSGLLVLGDAFCIYDPIFGQGMTVAAIEAEMLESCLREQRNDPKPHFEQRVLQKLQDVIEPAWWLNCANDLQWEGVKYVGSEPLKGIDFAKNYMPLFLKHATTQRDFKLFGMYWAVNTLSFSPREIINPQMVTTVLTASDEGRQLLAKLSQQYGQPLEEVLDQLVPSFSGAPFMSMSK